MQDQIYLQDAVARCLADRGLPGTVEIRPNKPLAARLESGERAVFVVHYDGVGSAHLVLDEWQIAGGTIGAPVAKTIAEKIERELGQQRIAA